MESCFLLPKWFVIYRQVFLTYVAWDWGESDVFPNILPDVVRLRVNEGTTDVAKTKDSFPFIA